MITDFNRKVSKKTYQHKNSPVKQNKELVHSLNIILLTSLVPYYLLVDYYLVHMLNKINFLLKNENHVTDYKETEQIIHYLTVH